MGSSVSPLYTSKSNSLAPQAASSGLRLIQLSELVLVEMFKAHLVMIQRKPESANLNPYARKTETRKGPVVPSRRQPLVASHT